MVNYREVNKMTKIKKSSMPIYLTPDQKAFIQGESNRQGIAMTAYIINLINNEMKKK